MRWLIKQRKTLLLLCNLPLLFLSACEGKEAFVKRESPVVTENRQAEEEKMKIKVQVGEAAFKAVLEENSAAQELAELLRHDPLTMQMSEYAGFEKVGFIGKSLPADDVRMTSRAGDIVLYNENQLVLFYGSNTWSYTKIAHIDDLSGWKEALGNGDVTVRLSIEGE